VTPIPAAVLGFDLENTRPAPACQLSSTLNKLPGLNSWSEWNKGTKMAVPKAPDSQRTLMKYVGEVIPSAASTRVRQVLAQTTGGRILWLTLLFALWSSSSATAALIDTLNAIYDLKESRPWWKSRVIAVTLAIAMGVLMTAALTIVMYGSAVLHRISHGSAVFFVWKIAQWPTAALPLILTLMVLYGFAPNLQKQKWELLLPGSIVAAAFWMAGSVLFKLYVRHFSDFGVLYGSLGTLA
jgi:membrane protein